MKRAIILDDEELCRELIKNLISRYNVPIEIIGEASSGDEGLELILKLNPDVVYLDIQMPVHNGIEVMKKIKNSNRDEICFIIITAYNYFEYAQAALRLGAKDILLKPIDYEEFIKTMERVLGYKYTSNHIFNEILEYINHNYEKNMELNECAKKYHTSPEHITRMCKKYIGKTFITYVNELKIKKAKILLRETDLSIKEIADQVGYNNMNYFYRSFKKQTGITPKVFKNGNVKN